MYTYAAMLVRVIDGDTLMLDLDLGFHMWLKGARFRLLRIDCPEMNTQAGKDAAVWLAQFLMGKKLTAQTFKGDSFGRWLSEVTVDGENCSDALVAVGHAAYKTY